MAEVVQRQEIVMQVKRTVVKTYICDKCKTPYTSAKACMKCELLGVEDPIAKVGDKVRILEPRQCSGSDKPYVAKGVISEISGPLPVDVEYERKWLGGKSKRLNSHTRSYLVSYKCPRCRESRSQPVFVPEFVAVKSSSTGKTPKRRLAKQAS